MFIIKSFKEMRWFFLKHSSVNIFGIFIRDSNKLCYFLPQKIFKNSFAWHEKSAVLPFLLQKTFNLDFVNKKIFFFFRVKLKNMSFEVNYRITRFLRICLIFNFNCILICFPFFLLKPAGFSCQFIFVVL